VAQLYVPLGDHDLEGGIGPAEPQRTVELWSEPVDEPLA
jgi:hypothetical protein